MFFKVIEKFATFTFYCFVLVFLLGVWAFVAYSIWVAAS